MKHFVNGAIVIMMIAAGMALAACEQAGGPPPNDAAKLENGDDVPEYPEGWEDWEEEEEDPPVVVGIEIASLPDKTIYPNNVTAEDLDFAGLVVQRVWDNGMTTELTGYTIDTSKAKAIPGVTVARRITVSWDRFETDFSILIDKSNRILQSVAATGSLPAYQELGKDFDFGTLVVTGTYNEGEPEVINKTLYTVSGVGGLYDKRKRGPQTVSIKANGYTVGGSGHTYDVTVKVPANAAIRAIAYPNSFLPGKSKTHKPVYIKGEAFSVAGSGLTVFVETTGGQTVPLTYANGGLTSADPVTDRETGMAVTTFSTAGMWSLSIALDNGKTVDFDVFVADIAPEVYFDYGYMRHADDPAGKGPGAGKYYTKKDQPLVLAPVLYLIGINADHSSGAVSYSWTVSGGEYDENTPRNEETFTFIPSEDKTYTVNVSVTGRNYVTGIPETRVATTEVVSYSGTVGSTGATAITVPRKDFAPGQFTQRGTGYGWSLGAALGYEVWSVPAGTTSVAILGNGFNGWHEPGIVWVQADDNGNGLPDEMWYEVKGSDDDHETYKNLILRRYAITYIKSSDEPGITNEYGQIVRTICWVDSRGRAGAFAVGWPTVGNEKGITGVAGTWITYTGTLLRDGGDNINNRTSIFERGYVDIYHKEDIQTCFVLLANAIRADRTPASLSSIRFVKVQTAYFEYDTPSGDISTEIVRSDPGFIDQSGGFPNPLGSMR